MVCSRSGHRTISALVSLTAVATISGLSCQLATSVVANAGPNQTVSPGATVTLDGSASFDRNGDPLNFAWTQVSGASVTLNEADTAMPTFVAPDQDGVLVFRLTVSNGQGGAASDTVTVNVGSEGNQPPTADAGADQTVAGGSTVDLDGSASSDPDGDPLSFSWTQTAGSAVTLTGADTATPSFTAPNAIATLTFELTVDDGNGGVDTDSVNVNVANQTRLFVANLTGNSLVSFADPAAVTGNVAPTTHLAGALTVLDSPADAVVNLAGRLIVANSLGRSLTSYDDAAAAGGDQAPDGHVSGGNTLLFEPVSLAINLAQDLLFVAEVANDDILVFAGTGGTLDGNVPPVRAIASVDLNNPFGIDLGANGDLYVANNGPDDVVVFANAGALNGNVNATRIINSAVFGSLFDVFVDDNDTMFVVDAMDGEVYVFSDASSLDGGVTPDFTLQVPQAVQLTAIVVDSNGTGYIADFGAGAVYVYDNVSTQSGAVNPDRIISGDQTQLSGPVRLFLVE